MGELALLTTISFLAQIMISFGIDGYFGVNFIKNKNNPEQLQNSMGTALTLLLIIGVSIGILLCVFGQHIFSTLFRKSSIDFFPFGFLSILTALFNSFSKTYSSLLINKQQQTRFFYFNLFSFLATIALSLGGLYLFKDSLWGPVLGKTITSGVLFIYSLFFLLKEHPLRYDPSFTKDVLSYSAPLFLYFTFTWILNYADRVIIEKYLNLKDVAIYDFATKPVLILELLQTGLFSAFSPKVYTIWNQQNIRHSTVETNRYYNGFTALFLLIIPLINILFVLIIPFIVKNEVYYDSFLIVPIISAGYALRGLLLLYLTPIYYFKQTKALPLIYCLLAIAQIVLMILGIHYFALIGLLFAVLIVKILLPFMTGIFSKRFFDFNFNKLKNIFLPLFYIAIVIISQQFITTNNYWIIYTIQLLIIYLFVYFVYRKELLFLAQSFSQKATFRRKPKNE